MRAKENYMGFQRNMFFEALGFSGQNRFAAWARVSNRSVYQLCKGYSRWMYD
jgi:hypothetical protein